MKEKFIIEGGKNKYSSEVASFLNNETNFSFINQLRSKYGLTLNNKIIFNRKMPDIFDLTAIRKKIVEFTCDPFAIKKFDDEIKIFLTNKSAKLTKTSDEKSTLSHRQMFFTDFVLSNSYMCIEQALFPSPSIITKDFNKNEAQIVYGEHNTTKELLNLTKLNKDDSIVQPGKIKRSIFHIPPDFINIKKALERIIDKKPIKIFRTKKNHQISVATNFDFRMTEYQIDKEKEKINKANARLKDRENSY